MTNSISNSFAFIGIFLLIIFAGCKKNEPLSPGNNPNINTPVNSYTPPAVTFSNTVRGFVIDINGNAIKDAAVTAGNKKVFTDENGAFTIVNVPFTGDFCYIKAEKNNFFTASNTVKGKASDFFQTKLTLMPHGNTVTFNATEAKEIKLPNGAEVDFPANAVQNAKGEPYTGQVTVHVAHLDPSAPNFREIIPGGDLRAFNANQENVRLYSFGMLNVELRDNNGNLLQLNKNTNATLKIPVPQSQLSKAPAQIPLWYFDENKGVWIEEGSATLNGNIYEGTVTHFTPWNVDMPFPRATVTGRIVDHNGVPVKYAEVLLNQGLIITSGDGTFYRDIIAGQPTLLDVYDRTAPGNSHNLNISINPLAEGQVYNLGDIKLAKRTKLKATVKNCDSTAFDGYVIFRSGGVTHFIYVCSSVFEMLVFAQGQQAELAYYSNGKSISDKVTFTPGLGEIDLGDVYVCKDKPEGFIKFTYKIGNEDPAVVNYSFPDFAGFTHKANDNYSQLYIGGTMEMPLYFFRIEGNSAGTYNINKNNNGGLPGMELRFITQDVLRFHPDAMQVVIKNFGNYNEPVTGTFSGTAYDASTQKSVIITNGEFKVIRTTDK